MEERKRSRRDGGVNYTRERGVRSRRMEIIDFA